MFNQGLTSVLKAVLLPLDLHSLISLPLFIMLSALKSWDHHHYNEGPVVPYMPMNLAHLAAIISLKSLFLFFTQLCAPLAIL